jgi:DNA relaxase NicK
MILRLTDDGQPLTDEKILKTQKYKAQAKLEAQMNASIYPKKFESQSILKQSLLNAAGYSLASANGQAQAALDDATPPPINNMGGMKESIDYQVDTDFFDGTEKLLIVAKGTSGRTKCIRIPKKNSNVSELVGFVDQVSFTIKNEQILTRKLSFPYDIFKGEWTESDTVSRLSTILIDIFGFGVTVQRDKGVNFYKESYNLGDSSGLLSFGGQNNTVNVQIYGLGAQIALDGWEQRLYKYLKIVNGKITRIDIAADFYDGSYSVEDAEKDYLNGRFTCAQRAPYCERRGDWYTGRGGRTLYIGKRASGKVLRVYEKALEILGNLASSFIDDDHFLKPFMNWVRVECEWHNQDRICDLEMLIKPGQYLSGSYPAFNALNVIQSKVQTFKKKIQMTFERSLLVTRHGFGRHLKTLREFFDNDSELLEKLTHGKDYLKFITQSVLNPDHSDYINFDKSLDTTLDDHFKELAYIDAIPL